MVVTPGCTRFDDPSSFSPVYVHQISQRCNRLICGEQNPTNHLGRTFGPKMRPTSYSSVADDITIRNVSLMNYANSFFPRTIRDWNSLPSDPSLRQTPDSFKSYLIGQLRTLGCMAYSVLQCVGHFMIRTLLGRWRRTRFSRSRHFWRSLSNRITFNHRSRIRILWILFFF